MKLLNFINILILIFFLHFRNSSQYKFNHKKFITRQYINVNSNKNTYHIKAALVKENNPTVFPRMKEFKLEIKEEKLNLIPLSVNQLGITLKYSNILFIDGQIIFTLKHFKEIKNKYYSLIRNSVKYGLQQIEIDDQLEQENTFVIFIKKLLNESSFEYKFLLFTLEGKINDIPLKQIFDNFVNYLSLFGKSSITSFNLLNASNESNDNFCNLNYQTFHDEEELKLFYWTDYNLNQISNSNLNNFYTFLTNEGIVLSSKDSKEILNNVKHTFRYDQIVDCEGISDPKNFEFILNAIDQNTKTEIKNVKCCVVYNTIWNESHSSKEFFCSNYDSYNQCKAEIVIFSQTVFTKCVFAGISHLTEILSENGCNIDDVIYQFTDLNKIKYYFLLKNLKNYKIYPKEQPQSDNRELPYDCSTDCLQNFQGLENLLEQLKDNLDEFLNKFEIVIKELDISEILNNVVRRNDVDRTELKEKISENLKSQNFVVTKCVCECLNRLTYLDDMIPSLIEMINRNVPFPTEIFQNICAKDQVEAELKKSELDQIRKAIKNTLNENILKIEEMNNKKNFLKIENNKVSPLELNQINREEEEKRLERLKNFDQELDKRNPLNFLMDSYNIRKKNEIQAPSQDNNKLICMKKNKKDNNKRNNESYNFNSSRDMQNNSRNMSNTKINNKEKLNFSNKQLDNKSIPNKDNTLNMNYNKLSNLNADDKKNDIINNDVENIHKFINSNDSIQNNSSSNSNSNIKTNFQNNEELNYIKPPEQINNPFQYDNWINIRKRVFLKNMPEYAPDNNLNNI